MIKEVEIFNPTGVMYLQDNPYTELSADLAKTLNIRNPAFSLRRTGQDARLTSQEHPEISASLLPYHFLSLTTGCELRDIDIVVVVEKISEHITTDYQVTFERKGWVRTSSDARPMELRWTLDKNSASLQAERLREISGLTIERLAEIFDVSRTTYHKWITGSPLHDRHRERLLEVLSLMEEAAQRLGSPNATNSWLLTPASPGGKKPVEYLAAGEYALFRGFLLRVRTGQEAFRPLTPSNRLYKERSLEETKAALERLRPRAWINDEDIDSSDTDEEGV